MDAFDLAIIGGGIIGAFAAYNARTTRPDLHVLLLEQNLIGSGATYYSGGHMHPHGTSTRQRELAAKSIERYRELASALPECRFQVVPLFGIIHRESAEAAIGGYVGQTIRHAEANENERLTAFFPGLSVGRDQVLLAGCTSGYGTPAAVTQALVDSLRRQDGFACWESVPVTNVESLSSGFRLWSNRPVCTARQVICCTGPWLLGGPHPAALPPLDARVKKVAAMHINLQPPPDAPIL
jgi:glycine/D-amino acid oxidase-like deaminating enzyme